MENKDIMDMLEGRRTYRRFDGEKEIGDEVVADMMRAAQLASSAMNRQPLRYIYVRDKATVDAIFEITSWGGSLPNGLGRPRAGEQPVMFVVMLSVKELQTRFTEFDSGLAVSNLTLAAWGHGVGSCILGSTKIDKLRSLLDIPEELDVSVVVAFGYPTHTSRVVEGEGDDMKYSLDENMNYVVPKRKISDTVIEHGGEK